MLFTIWNDLGWDPAQIAVQRAGEPDHHVLVAAGGGYPRFIPDGGGTSGILSTPALKG